ncbi:MAG: LacI family transcriptional regulator [Oscillospiraceae bacterium]|nr:LacI family transcriptional regulator [Oscillospiraceae bacterium]
MKKGQVRIKDIATEAGVSVTTVSYILNNSPSQTFAPETIERVNGAARKLGYVPNMAARALVSDNSRMLGVVIPQTEPHKEFMFSNPFYGDFLSSVEYTARQNGYHILISGTNADQTYLEVARTRSLDGIIIVGMYPEGYYAELKKTGIPTALVDCYCDDDYFPAIHIDDCRGGYLATKYLLDKGHRVIAHVTGLIKDHGVNQQRMLGWRRALEEAGAGYDRSLLYDGEVSYEYGAEAGKRIAENFRESGVSAAFVSADITALGLYNGLRTAGATIPSDISVVSFDGTWLSGVCDPGLTTIRQDVALKGKTAVEVILSLIDGGLPGNQKITLPISLVERGSVREVKCDG